MKSNYFRQKHRRIAERVVFIMETISLNPKTIIVKAEKESDISAVLDFIFNKNRRSEINELLLFASQHRVIESEYVFNRDECYG